ncbi:MAG TPA: hypothetical protein VGI81_21470 [Tepidisphaeraceae bacterium]|jgi:uncharacterized membrane protein
MLVDASWTYVILLRWVHVICAALLIGGTFFLAFLLPWRSRGAEGAAADDSWFLGARRSFKITTHACILFLLLSGIYNAYGNWHAYTQNPAQSHSLFGSHVLLALIVFTLLLVLFARRQPRPGERTWLRAIVVLLFLTVLIASSLKYVRDHTHAPSSTSTVPSATTQPGTAT